MTVRIPGKRATLNLFSGGEKALAALALLLAAALTKVADVQPLLSMSRYVLVMFPGFVLLARLGQRSAWHGRRTPARQGRHAAHAHE